jgi:hypothetical protein
MITMLSQQLTMLVSSILLKGIKGVSISRDRIRNTADFHTGRAGYKITEDVANCLTLSLFPFPALRLF